MYDRVMRREWGDAKQQGNFILRKPTYFNTIADFNI